MAEGEFLVAGGGGDTVSGDGAPDRDGEDDGSDEDGADVEGGGGGEDGGSGGASPGSGNSDTGRGGRGRDRGRGRGRGRGRHHGQNHGRFPGYALGRGTHYGYRGGRGRRRRFPMLRGNAALLRGRGGARRGHGGRRGRGRGGGDHGGGGTGGGGGASVLGGGEGGGDAEEDFCYNGVCGNRDKQCRHIWGPTGSNAAPVCYAQNDQGNYIGNCGHDLQTDGFSKCHPKDVLCGRLQCNHETEKLAFGDPSTVRSAYSTARLPTGENIACRVIWTKYVGTKKDPDPGMVPDGTFCGADRMCVGTKCENRTETVKLAPKCIPESCNDAGVCNNMGNCHCNPGYGGTGCAIPGYGGSVNSGPSAEGSVIHVGHVVFWILIAFVIIFIGGSIFIKRKKNVWLHKQIWHRVKKVTPNQHF